MGQQIKVLNHRESRVVLARETRDDKGVLKIDELLLQGGANNVDADRVDAFRKNEVAESFFASGLLTIEGVVGEPTEEKLPAHGGDLSRLKLKSALNAIKGCKDVRQLRSWVNQDGRAEVREACIARHTELTKTDESPKAD